MGNYVTVAGRPHPHWGTDPCPGDPEAVEVLAGRLQDYGERAGVVSAFFEGASEDLAAAGSWHGESQLAFDQVMKRFPMNLRPVSDALDGVAAALRGWAGELRELQSDTLYLDWRLGDARRIEKQSWERLVAFEQGAGPLEPDQRHEWNQLTMLHEEALARQREAEAALTERENTYRERAVHYGALIRDSHIGGMYGVGPGIRIGSWLEDTWLGSVARWSAPVAGAISEAATATSAGLLVGATMAAGSGNLPVVAFLLGSAGAIGTVGTVADLSLAISGYGDWSTVALGLGTVGIGRAAQRAVARGRDANQGPRVTTGTGHSYAPSYFTSTELTSSQITWQRVGLANDGASWAITGYALSQSLTPDDEAGPVPVGLTGYAGVDPWDLPPNIAYLEDQQIADLESVSFNPAGPGWGYSGSQLREDAGLDEPAGMGARDGS